MSKTDDRLERLKKLSPQKRALLLKALREEASRVEGSESIPKISEPSSAVLSFAQARFWFLDQLQPDSSAYNMPVALRLQGALNVTALRQSLNEIVRRHEVLRTTFVVVEGQPTPVIAPNLTLAMPVTNLQELSETEREIRIQQLAVEEAERPFNLAQGPLLRSMLLHVGDSEYVLLFTMHHIISDGWSMGILVRELMALYEAFSNQQPSGLPELPLQYADFAVWQRQWLQGEVLEAQLNYWKQQLDQAPPILELPTDRPRPAVQTDRGKTQSLVLSKSLSEALKAISQQEGVTLFMLLLAAFKTLLHRYTRQEDILIGSPIANRNRVEIEGLIGPFANTLVLRTDLSGNPSFREYLQRVRQVCLEAYAHQDLPLEKLVEELQPDRNLSRNSMFQVWFALNNNSVPALELSGLTLTPLTIEEGTAQLDLSLEMSESPQGLIGSLQYSTDLFEDDTISRMLGHFQVLLQGIVANPDQALSDLPLLSAAQQQQLLYEWNDTQANYPQKCIHELFEAQVERSPNAIAVVFGEQQLTYSELNTRANQLAHYLQKLGVTPEGLVGICVERSIEMIVGILGILKAGGAYVPLDPAYPQERLAFMLSDSQVSVLLTTENLVARSRFEHPVQMVYLDTHWKTISQENEANPISGVNSENLAYVIYTSGSTGKPKGVMIQHQSLASFTQTAIFEYGLTQQDRVLQLASISFDAAAEEIYPCLACGGMLVLRTDEMLSSVPAFLQKCRDWELTVLDLPTAYWHEMTSEIAMLSLALPDSLRLVIIGGERALPDRVELWRKCVGNYPQLANTYGPTEATVVTTIYKFPELVSRESGWREVPIGRPIHNVRLYLLDEHLQLVPVGVPGELYIGGAGLARGYLNRPELTAQMFIPNPWSDRDGELLYKTGDLARYLPDGTIEYINRIDHQVKIRGFRIELGEVEAMLSQHPKVRETVVILREDDLGDKRLVAYIVPSAHSNQQQVLTTTELRKFLEKKLPDYMMPSAFMLLDSLPLTPNGKVDRRALPVPDRRPELEATFIEPRTPAESVVAQIWSQLLGLEQVGVCDNFFELGGHSLLATQVISRLQDTFRVEFPLRHLFETPTVEGLVNALAQLWGSREVVDAIAQTLQEVEQLSVDDVRTMLSKTNTTSER